MNSQRLLRKPLWAISVLLAGSVVALAQNHPAADIATTGNGEAPLPPSFETTVGHSPDAGFYDLGFGQSRDSRWTASADFIFMQRVGNVPYILVEMVPSSVRYEDLSKTAGTPVLNASDFRHGFSGGPRVGLMHHGDDGTDLEVSYFQIDGWDSYRAIGPTPDDWLVMRAPGNFLQTQDSPLHLNEQMMAWGYASRLHNAEANMRWNPWRGVTVLAGFRWVNLTEELVGILAPPGTDGAGTFWDTQTSNNLYGAQIGADAKLLERNRFSIDGVLKLGIFDNHVDETTSVRMERIQFPESDSTDHLAFVGEVGVQCKYHVTPRLSLRVGYEVMWLQGVALAPGQIPETYSSYGGLNPLDTHVQAVGVNCNSGVLFHGGAAGLEYTF